MLGPGSACRASVAVATIMPFSFRAIVQPFLIRRINSRKPAGSKSVEPSTLSDVGLNSRETRMADKFDPALKDKHAEDPKDARKADKAVRNKLDKGWKERFRHPTRSVLCSRQNPNPMQRATDFTRSAVKIDRKTAFSCRLRTEERDHESLRARFEVPRR